MRASTSGGTLVDGLGEGWKNVDATDIAGFY
jgi:hypothetical protein